MRDVLDQEHIERLEELATENIEAVRETVDEKLNTAKRKIADVADELKERQDLAHNDSEGGGLLTRVKETLHEKGRVFEEKQHQVSSMASEGYHRLRDNAGELGSQVKLFTRKNPVTSTAVAMGLGLVTGLAIRQARR